MLISLNEIWTDCQHLARSTLKGKQMFSLCREFRLEVLGQPGWRLGGEGAFAQHQFSLSHLRLPRADRSLKWMWSVASSQPCQGETQISEASDKSQKSKQQLQCCLGYAEPWRGCSWCWWSLLEPFPPQELNFSEQLLPPATHKQWTLRAKSLGAFLQDSLRN